MIILKRSLFSRHTPKGLKKYKEYKDEDFDKMTKGQKIRALEEEDATARDNTNKYLVKKVVKWAPAGALAVGIPAAIVSRKGEKLVNGLAGGFTGGIGGATIGAIRGQYFADKEGHNRDKRSLKLARRLDENARKNHLDDDFEYRVKDNIRARQAAEDARMARDYAAMSYYNSL